MARADLLVQLIRSGITNDKNLFLRVAKAIASDARAKNHHILADRIGKILAGDGPAMNLPSDVESFLLAVTPKKGMPDLILSDETREICQQVAREHISVDVLKSHGLEPRNRILLVGPPGNGKTSLAEAIASDLMVPMYAVRYERIVGSLLGETAARLNKVFDWIQTQNCVLFFDEFDTLGKERGDKQETGEIKRVVSTLLLQIDALPSSVVVVAATNHAELLDKAAWRRFQVRIELPTPDKKQLSRFFEAMASRFESGIGLTPAVLAEKLHGTNFAEAEEFAMDVQRQYVLSFASAPSVDITTIAESQMAHWMAKKIIAPPVSTDRCERSANNETRNE